MSDFYTEQLIKKRKTGKDLVIQILLVMAVIVSCLVIFIFPLGIILPVGVAVLAIFLNNRLDVEIGRAHV